MSEKIASREMVFFNLGNEKFALTSGQVKSIEEMQDIVPVPLAPVYVSGLINLRGAIITVVDLRKRVGLQAEMSGRDMVILVAEHNGEDVGLIVDRVLSVEIPQVEAKPVPESVAGAGPGRFYQMVLEQGKEKIVILNIDKILALEER